jgi:hypothetical protein
MERKLLANGPLAADKNGVDEKPSLTLTAPSWKKCQPITSRNSTRNKIAGTVKVAFLKSMEQVR